MREPDFYRYFLGFRPDETIRALIVSIAKALAIDPGFIKPHLLHLTLFVIDETPRRDSNLAERIDGILGRVALDSCRVKLGRVHSGTEGATLKSIGTQREVQLFYRRLVELLSPLNIEPKHRKSGLNAHVTLSHRPISTNVAVMPFEWLPNELLLIESWHGCSHHQVLARWPISAPVQGEFRFCRGATEHAVI